MIERIEKKTEGAEFSAAQSDTLGNLLDATREKTQDAMKSFIRHKGLFVGLILTFIVIVVFTTKIDLTSATELVRLGLVVFVLIFCSYTMYVNCSDSGARAGKAGGAYRKAICDYETEKQKLTQKRAQSRLSEFCRYYIETELKNARKDVLDEVGLDYETYARDYVGLDAKTVKSKTELSESKMLAVLRANSVKPVRLTPEMLMKCGRGHKRRNPLGIKPETKRGVNYAVKFLGTVLTSAFTGVIALDIIVEPSWATFAELCLKLLTVLLSGFAGYKMGYENITVDTVNYIHDQTELLRQCNLYIEENDEPPIA